MALFEAGMGGLVLLGCGALPPLGRDLDQLAARFVGRSHLNLSIVTLLALNLWRQRRKTAHAR